MKSNQMLISAISDEMRGGTRAQRPAGPLDKILRVTQNVSEGGFSGIYMTLT